MVTQKRSRLKFALPVADQEHVLTDPVIAVPGSGSWAAGIALLLQPAVRAAARSPSRSAPPAAFREGVPLTADDFTLHHMCQGGGRQVAESRSRKRTFYEFLLAGGGMARAGLGPF